MKAAQIEDYFGQMHDQILAMAEDPTVISAMKDFNAGFSSVSTDLRISETGMLPVNAAVDEYFTQQYLKRLNRNLDRPAKLEEESSTNPNARVLQEMYIASNSFPVGSKHKLDDPGDGSTYSKSHRFYHPVLRNYLKKFGYYDIFLVDIEDGDIVYTCFKEVDFGTSLISGPFSKTNLARSFRAAKESNSKAEVHIVDFEPYHPSYNAPAAFISTAIYEGDRKTGVLIFQMPIDRINDIMTNKRQWTAVGLGQSGETYIVGDDYTLRNQSRFLIEDSTNYFRMIEEIEKDKQVVSRIHEFNSSIGLQRVRTAGTEAALKGESGEKIFPDYRAVPVLSSYKPLKIEGMHWVIMSEIDESEAFSYVNTLRRQLLMALFVLLLIIAAGSMLISRRITRPLKTLSFDAMELAKGNFDVEINIKRKDEIGILALSFRKMQISIKNLIEELRHINQNLEEKVVERTQEIHRQKELVEHQNKEILDSINYALRLQQAILPPRENFETTFHDSFVLFKPKDIVSGDFYWLAHRENHILVAAVDCTGHGVPGAMVSMVGSNGLEQCVGEFGLRKTSDILDKLRELVIKTFESKGEEVKDGMDIALVSMHYTDASRTNAVIEYSGANNPLWIMRKGAAEIEETKADKQPIGVFDFGKPFNAHRIELQKGDCFYLFTDGYADQFGGPNGKKFRYKPLKTLLQSIYEKPMAEQNRILDETFESWRGELQQIDDVCIIGIRI